MNTFRTFTIIALVVAQFMANATSGHDPVTNDLRTELIKPDNNEFIRINIRMKEQYDIEAFQRIKQSFTKNQRREYIIAELKAFAERSQQGIVSDLNYFSRNGQVKNIQRLWIANVLNCYATREAIEQLAKRPDIERIDIDEERILIDPEIKKSTKKESIPNGREITWNLLNVNAPDVWALGHTGEDVVVAVLDTGVNYNHDDLDGNMWEHPDYPYHGWSFTSNNNDPMDYHGHGTHCAGTVAGQGASGSQTGVAPNAKIMALQVLTSSGGGTESGVWSAIQFGVDYGADILSLSLGWQHSWGPDRASWRDAMNNALAAGVIASVAAGNEGDQQGSYPIPDNVRTPGDIPPPWLNPDQSLTGGISAVVCVGATDSGDGIAYFSSRGPVTWQSINPYNDYAYNPGMGLIRPDVVAPGVSIKSLSHSGTNAYTNMSGTSMATPCVAGVMALMVSKNPNIFPEQIAQILEETTVVLQAGKNNTSGSGRVDALAAVNATTFPGPVYASHIINDINGNNNSLINPDELILLTVTLSNGSDGSYSNVSATLSSDSPFITITDNSAFFGNFAPGTTIEITDAFSFQVAPDIIGGQSIKFRIEATDGSEIWQSAFTETATAPNLNAGNLVVYDPDGNANGILDPLEDAVLQIQTLNTGQVLSEPVSVTLTSASPYVTIHTSNLNLGSIGAGASVQANFPVTIAEDAPYGQGITFLYTIISGAYNIEKTYVQPIGIIIEDFESGDFSQFNWYEGGIQPWTITGSETYEGVYSSRSGVISHSQTSQLILDYEVGEDGEISFFRKVSSESNYDYLMFYINDVMAGQWSGTLPWEEVSFPVTAGFNTFKWEFMKDGSVSSGDDCAWIDYIILPVMTACPGPSNLEASSVTSSSALLSWVAGSNENAWDILWGQSGFDPETEGELIPDIPETSYALTGLQPLTSYDFYVRSHCAEMRSVSAWSGPSGFITSCGLASLPFSESFEPTSASCWTFPDGQGNWAFGNSYTPPSSTSGSPNAYFDWTPTITDYSFILQSPVLNASNFTGVQIEYSLFVNSYNSGTIENMAVEYKAINDPSWVLLENFSNEGLGSGQQEFLRTNQPLENMDGKHFQVRFRAYGTNSFSIWGWGLDDILVQGTENELPELLNIGMDEPLVLDGGDPPFCANATQTIHVYELAVQSGGHADLIAGQNIIFHPGTSVLEGGFLWARITTTEDYCNQPDNILASEEILAEETADIIPDGSFFKVFPNPTTGIVQLSIINSKENKDITVEVYDILGERFIKQDFFGSSHSEIDLSGMPKGIYFIRVFRGSELGVEKVIKQ